MSTNDRTLAGVSPAITTSARIGAPPTRRSTRSNVYVRSIRPLVFFVAYDVVTSRQRSMRSSTHPPSACCARRWPESTLTSGRLSVSASVLENQRRGRRVQIDARLARVAGNKRAHRPAERRDITSVDERVERIRPPPANSTNVVSESFELERTTLFASVGEVVCAGRTSRRAPEQCHA
jgi:hypothetical protein